MKAKEGNLLTAKLNQLKKMVFSIKTDPKHPGAEALRVNSIKMMDGIIKDIEYIYNNDKKFFRNQKENKSNHKPHWKSGYPCKPIKPRSKHASTRHTSFNSQRPLPTD